jgi:glycosyltransferase involved in cell wall biosynthesis
VAISSSLRICVVGDLDGVHTHRWVHWFVERGHDVHGISYYQPQRPPPGVKVHVLVAGGAAGGSAAPLPGRGGWRPAARRLAEAAAPSLWRLINGFRYQRGGLRRIIENVEPDVVHAHYVVEHGFYAALACRTGRRAGSRPLVVTAWGSDVLLAPRRSPLARAIARYTLRRADLVTSNNEYMTRRLVDLGAPADRVELVILGADAFFLEAPDASVNLRPGKETPPTVISLRSLDSRLYNVDVILRAMGLVRRRIPDARLLVAGEGRLRAGLERLARRLGLEGSAIFLGYLPPPQLRDALASAHVCVSVPRSDATAVSTLEAMAVGCLPIVSDLPSQEELVRDGENGFRVPVGDADALAQRIVEALERGDLRRQALEQNQDLVARRGVLEENMARMEELYRGLAGRARGTGGRPFS